MLPGRSGQDHFASCQMCSSVSNLTQILLALCIWGERKSEKIKEILPCRTERSKNINPGGKKEIKNSKEISSAGKCNSTIYKLYREREKEKEITSVSCPFMSITSIAHLYTGSRPRFCRKPRTRRRKHEPRLGEKRKAIG